jgi:hypothetical protein
MAIPASHMVLGDDYQSSPAKVAQGCWDLTSPYLRTVAGASFLRARARAGILPSVCNPVTKGSLRQGKIDAQMPIFPKKSGFSNHYRMFLSVGALKPRLVA